MPVRGRGGCHKADSHLVVLYDKATPLSVTRDVSKNLSSGRHKSGPRLVSNAGSRTRIAKRPPHNDRYCGERESDLEIEGVMTDLTSPRMVGNPDEQLIEAAEELIAGDSDDPPLSEDSIQEMLNDSPARGSDL